MSNVHLDRFMSYRVNRVSEAVVRIVSKVYEREVDLTLRELRVLRTVGSAGGIVHSAIVEQVLFEKSLVSRLIAGLVRKSYLKREIDERDARRTWMTLTKEGAAVLQKADKLGLAMNRVWLSALDVQERKSLDASLDKLLAGLDRLAERFDVPAK